MLDIRTDPITGPSAWYGDDLGADRRWQVALEAVHIAELERALETVKRRGLTPAQIGADDFPLPKLEPLLGWIVEELRDGRGFACVRNFPVAAHSLQDLEIMYWGFCAHIGTELTQNGDAGLIHYVTDGKLRPHQGRRGVGFPQETKLHIDLTDMVALLCVRQAPDDPPSRVASSMTVYNELLKRCPDALPRLYAGFEWDRMDEHGVNEAPSSGYRIPLFSHKEGVVSCQYNRNWMVKAAERNGCALSDEDTSTLDLIDAIAREICFEFPVNPGDIQFCNNYTVLHGRPAHAIVEDEERKRLLMRIWFDMPNVRAFFDDAIIRYGNGRHGQIGWSAADVLAGRNLQQRLRRADGAVVTAE